MSRGIVVRKVIFELVAVAILVSLLLAALAVGEPQPGSGARSFLSRCRLAPHSQLSAQGISISRNGLSLFFHPNRPGGVGGNDVHATTLRPDGKFAAAAPGAVRLG